MGTLTLQNIRNTTYKLLNEYQTVTADIDLNITNRVDEQINLAYQELATKSKISASFFISQFPIDNLLYPSSQSTNNLYWDDSNDGGTFVLDTYEYTALSYVAASAKSYYFEVDNACYVDILEYSGSESATTLSTLELSSVSVFTPYTGFITAVSAGDTIKFSFYSTGNSHTFALRNIALYAYDFSGVTASIPYYQPYVEYAISSDFYDMNRVRYRYYDSYRTFSDYRIENDSSNDRKLLISREYEGEFIFDYWKRPSILASATDTFEIEDAYAYIIPWHVAGTILLSDGFNARTGLAMLQMYEQKKKEIKTSHNFGYQKLDNVRGW